MSGSPTRTVAGWVADADALSTAQRAILGYYAETGTFDYRALKIKSAVDDTLDGILSGIYADVEAVVAEAYGVDEADVSFTYETKLTLPAELTLGYLYRRALSRADGYDPVADEAGGLLSGGDPESAANREARAYVDRAEEATDLIVKALLDGDMRDAINDDEFEDFDVDVRGAADVDRRRVAELAQARLQREVETAFDRAPDAVREAYDRAVDISEGHQAQDERFRSLFRDALDGDETAVEGIEREYKFAPFPDDDNPFSAEERDLPYLKTQYDRVGVIYDGMLDAYRGIGFDVPAAFGKSIVLAIIGAQIWLDDVDDYRDDVAEEQLTPVTAEYVLAGDDAEAYDEVVDVATRYFDRAREYAEAADSPLNGIAIEYILRSGEPDRLPGSRP